jgi:hypothetical protein
LLAKKNAQNNADAKPKCSTKRILIVGTKIAENKNEQGESKL